MPLLEVAHLSYAYPDGRMALRSLSFSIEDGEKVALIGLNGAGKSTLLHCLSGVLKASGQIVVDGREDAPMKAKELCRSVGLVFQDPNDQLFMPTLYEDVAFGPRNMGLDKRTVDGRVTEALAAVGLSSYADRLTHHMSFGEKKRAALATILSMDPRLLLLDEPTSNLDPKRRREFISIMRSTPTAMIVATHDLAMVEDVCSKVLALKEGSLVFSGSASILGDRAFLEELELGE